MKDFYSIGEIAKLNFISPYTLRYYDELDLLKPSYVNENTGYRYYSHKDFLFLDAIQYLRHFGMSLEEIKEQFDSRTVEGTLELYKKQLVKLHENINALKNIEKRIAHNIENLKASKNLEFKEILEIVEHKKRYAVMVNDTVKNDDEYEVAIRKLSHALYKNHFRYMGDYIGIKDRDDIYNDDYNMTKAIGNMCIGKPTHMKPKAIPAGKYLRLCYMGATEKIDDAYKKILKYIEENHLTIADEIIETYVIDCIDTRDPNEYITVIEAQIELAY